VFAKPQVVPKFSSAIIAASVRAYIPPARCGVPAHKGINRRRIMQRRNGHAAGWRCSLVVAMTTAIMAGVAMQVGAKDDGAAPVKKLTGEQLYSINCSRCHAERYPPEFSKVQWKTLLFHMRVRANLPPAQAQAVYKYMLENK